jgi:tetratricopeptide (TPR) repeat protein
MGAACERWGPTSSRGGSGGTSRIWASASPSFSAPGAPGRRASRSPAPQQADILGNYAHFLWRVRKNPEKAEEFYQRAIEADAKNADNIGNYAGMLLAIGRQTDGLSMLDRALDAPDARLMTRVECWFYALVHRASERRGEVLAQLKQLIAGEGARSPGWDFSGNVERARSDGHPDVAWLALLADVISEQADPAVLQAWPAWAAA